MTDDKIVILSKSFLGEKFSKVSLDDIPLSEFDKLLADVVIIIHKDRARVVKNRYGSRKITMMACNVGNYVTSRVYAVLAEE